MRNQPLAIQTENLKVSCRAPSNIAFIKYWGKHGRQLPLNPSLSMTLNKSHTRTSIEIVAKKDNSIINKFLFENKPQIRFQDRIENYLNSITDELPWLNDYSLNIETINSFPHSAGIASSASAFAALGWSLEKINESLTKTPFSTDRASHLARLGSGSASRSLFSNFSIWGKTNEHTQSSDTHAIEFSDFHENFKEIQNTILIVNNNEKSVSSSAGHSLMHGHLFKDLRFEQAKDNLRVLINAMKFGDWESFGQIVETEALTLHALMMTSSPSFILLEPQSVAIIHHIRSFRAQFKIPLYFTIDAGPNIHMIYPSSVKSDVNDFIKGQLIQLVGDSIIYDSIGRGAEQVNA